MEAKPISSAELSKFITAQPPTSGSFLQTPAWLSFEVEVGAVTAALGWWQAGQLLAVAATVKRPLPWGLHYLYVPRGPLVTRANDLPMVLKLLVEYYQNSAAMFLRVEPTVTGPEMLAVNGFYKTISIQPAATLLTDLSKDEQQLLVAMHPKTRYNIRLAETKGLQWQLVGAEGLKDFWQLLQNTAKRDGFHTHTVAHYQQLLSRFGAEPLASSELALRLAVVRQGDKLLAGSLLVWSNGVVTYLHGASADDGRELMPAYLLHWQTMREAKKLGFKFYDWWGVSTSFHSRPVWQGITRFKQGFGGSVVDYAGTFDYPYHEVWYLVYRLARGLLR